MSRENASVVLAAIEVYNTGDLDAHIEFFASDVEVVPDAAAFPESVPLHGLREYRAWLEEAATAWLNPRNQPPTEVLDLGSDRVLVRYGWGGGGASSGIEMYSSVTGVFTVRDGQIRAWSSSSITTTPSKPSGCGSSDVAGERGDRQA